MLAQIRSGHWRPGEYIPKEQALADSFGCARMTAHRALRELAAEGVVERRRRSGTRVALQTAHNAIIEIPRVDREIEATGAQYRYQRIARSIVTPTTDVAACLELTAQQSALRVDCLHYASDVPFQLEQRWINLDTVPEAEHETFLSQPANIWLLERTPWSDVEHIISANNASSELAQHLEIELGEALLVMERRTWLAERVVTFVRQYHPGRFYTLRAGGNDHRPI